ncbi:YdhR family protein [Pontivivens ytuae]|uniref:YdhR family protein n=1 Tax=Pontivivens ytuae TaxID=2789856 RepID=A0A7S9LSM1_9RHOB|nr:YdhR family protein [Pontivivens ytuae]QPH54554.1 YdhR family protein [Pontivivens ytuae]
MIRPAFLLPRPLGGLALVEALFRRPDTPAPDGSTRGWGERISSAVAKLLMRGIAAGYSAKSDPPQGPQGGPVMLHITFRYTDLPERFRREMDEAAPFLSHVPGLISKLWAEDGAGQAAGNYLFDCRRNARMYLDEIFARGPGADPRILDVSIRILDVLTGPSRMTRALP